jgi:crotonobetainyl-CoA:carnitine CoA-transferase CaiB-like acyl-CoA transferase
VTQSLEGIRVVDLTQNLAGPYCSQILADLGAEVVKIEPPKGDAARAWGPPFWGEDSPLYLSANRNKRSVGLDLKTERGKEIVWRLIEEADVFVQALRGGVVERLGLDYASVKAKRPSLIYVSVSAYGANGPLKDLPGYDPLMQAYCGIMSVTGHPDSGPARVGGSVVDFGTGMWAALGVLSALHQRSDTGDGYHVSTSLMDTALGWVSYHLMGHMADGQIPGPMGSRFAMIAPYGAFPTNDGQLMIAAGSNALFGRLCAAFDLPELPGDPLYASNPSRVENRDKLFTILTAKTRQYGTRELWELMGANSVPAAPIQDMAAVVSDPQVAASGMLPAVDHPSIPNYRDVAIPVQWNNERPRTRTVPPRAGEHTREVLAEIGYSSDEIEGLLGDGIVIG